MKIENKNSCVGGFILIDMISREHLFELGLLSYPFFKLDTNSSIQERLYSTTNGVDFFKSCYRIWKYLIDNKIRFDHYGENLPESFELFEEKIVCCFINEYFSPDPDDTCYDDFFSDCRHWCDSRLYIDWMSENTTSNYIGRYGYLNLEMIDWHLTKEIITKHVDTYKTTHCYIYQKT